MGLLLLAHELKSLCWFRLTTTFVLFTQFFDPVLPVSIKAQITGHAGQSAIVSAGHSTVMGTLTVVSAPESSCVTVQ